MMVTLNNINLKLMILKFISVALIATFEIYAAIASGMAFGFSSHQLFITTLVGGIVGVFASVFLGNTIKTFIARFKKQKPVLENQIEKPISARTKLMNTLWAKYGVIGVGFIGSFLVGAPISIGIGIGFGVDAKKLLGWCLAAVIIRSFLFSYFFNYLKGLF
jgi:membrane protein YqaA with SNARE-associated domain